MALRSRRSVRLVPFAAAAGLSLAVAIAPTAQADTGQMSDARGDVAAVNSGRAAVAQAPAAGFADIVGVQTRHTAQKVTVRVTTVAPLGQRDFFSIVRVSTPRGSYDLLTSNRGAGATTSALVSETVPVVCSGIRHKVAGNALQYSVPRSCLGRPASVRIGVFLNATSDNRRRVFADVAGRNGRPSHRIPLSRAISAG